ncbi:ATP-binding cassette, subfamily C [Devosia sp. YR412]|uniref:type I secretion system permease/ATPase n=1 Tax=Devosia sp. YR412 TaxID=1881030 RepID=UPI0008CDD110|nr:type I secretion system permease/ATPase [Devosia sp. YR412]SEQ37566.1 ATP-binding cassette, subfamily C [Devosia sp. YR412]
MSNDRSLYPDDDLDQRLHHDPEEAAATPLDRAMQDIHWAAAELEALADDEARREIEAEEYAEAEQELTEELVDADVYQPDDEEPVAEVQRDLEPVAPLSPAAVHAAAAAQATAPRAEAPRSEFADRVTAPKAAIPPMIDAEPGPLGKPRQTVSGGTNGKPPTGSGGGGGNFHRRSQAPNIAESFQNGLNAVKGNLVIVMAFTVVLNVLVLAIPLYLFQISDRILTSRSIDTLVMLTILVVGAVILQTVLDAVRRSILMRTAVEVEVQLGAPILSAAARASLHGNGREYQVLGDLQQLRGFITSGTLLSMLDAPIAPMFVVAVFLIHPHLGYIVIGAALTLLILATINQRTTAKPFAEANTFLSRATSHLDSMSRNSQIINALAMIPEAVRIWGRDTALSLRAQVKAQDRNVVISSFSKACRLLTQVIILGWGAFLAIEGQMTGGMVIAASIIAARALTPIEGAIEGWNAFTQFRNSLRRIRALLQSSPLNFERLLLPEPKGRLDVERILFVPPPNKAVVLNGISFSLQPGESLAVIGNSGSGKTTLGKLLVGSILPTSGCVRLDMMDLRNWDQRQFGESIGYLPQDVQLFPGSIKANIARMRDDVPDQAVYDAAVLADVHSLIASFSQGYETFVAADGAPLSGGQKQRIALARAFFGNPKLVVLDEPNSNLDSQGEAALAKALVHARNQKITVVTITQRPALLQHVDKILVLNNGSVGMFGTRTEVLKALSGSSMQNLNPGKPALGETP